jgi:hypothetical protein
MNRLFSAKPLLAAALAFGALAGATAAHARADVVLSIGVPFGYVQPQPVYVQPQQYYAQPQSYYVEPQPYYVQPQTYYAQPQVIYGRGRGYEHRRRGWGDADHDGVPNRFDRAPHNPYYR